jgi:carbonic anhydrase/acetyltransferase-like protein (isoleucine patch superfamily)
MKKNYNLKNFVFIPQSTTIDPNAFINGEFIIGEHCTVAAGVKIFTRENMVMIGSHVTIGKNVNIEAYGKGKKTFVGNHVEVHDGAKIFNSCVANDVFIGKNVTVMKNSYISDKARLEEGAIIAPHSVVGPGQVCKSNTIYSGNPAKAVSKIYMTMSDRIDDVRNLSA